MDTIGNFLTKIRNALQAKHRYVDVPHSKMVEAMARLLFQKEMIVNLTVLQPQAKKVLRLILKYDRRRHPAIQHLQRISKPGARIYAKASKIPVIRNGFGFAMISTSQGVVDDLTARRDNQGGEIVCTIW